jgi:hypothetical protein
LDEKEDITGKREILPSERLHNFSSPYIVRIIESSRVTCLGHVAFIGFMIIGYNILGGKSGRKRPLVMLRRSCSDMPNIKMCLKRMWYQDVDWIEVARDRT